MLMNNKVICPNCGAEATAGRFCEYCGTKIPLPKPKRKKKGMVYSDETKRIFAFQSSEEDAVKKMLYRLTESANLPADFFQNCQINESRPYYIPVYYYQCSFEAPWSCVKLVTKEYEVYNHSTKRNETRKTTERYPMNGVAMDSFSYIVCASKKEDIPEELYDFINNEMKTSGTSFYDKSTERDLTDEERAILVENGELSENVLWKQYCEDFLDARVSRSVRSQLPGSYENLSYSYTYRSPCYDMILPFWVIHYSYNGKEYLFITDGLTKLTKIKSPIDENQVSENEALKNELQLVSNQSEWSIFYFILFSLVTVIMSLLFLDEQVASIWKLCLASISMLLTLINGYKTQKRLIAKKEIQTNLTSYLNRVWMQRKKSIQSILSHNSFGMSASKTKELRSMIQQEIEHKDVSVDPKANCLWIKIITFIVLVIFSICIIARI